MGKENGEGSYLPHHLGIESQPHQAMLVRQARADPSGRNQLHFFWLQAGSDRLSLPQELECGVM